MNVETLKRFLSEEWKAPTSSFALSRIGIAMIFFAPIWPFSGLLQSLPAHEELVVRNGVINSLESTNPKSGCGTRVRLAPQMGLFRSASSFVDHFQANYPLNNQ